jgi:hypothetical protein
VYRVDTVGRTWYQLNKEPLTDLQFEDPMLFDAGTLYAVRSVELIETGSGTYWQVSAAQFGSTRTASSEELSMPNVKVFPQPSTGTLNISGLDFALSIDWTLHDISGRMVETGSSECPYGGTSLQTHAPSGLYILTLSGNGQRFSQQIVINRP